MASHHHEEACRHGARRRPNVGVLDVAGTHIAAKEPEVEDAIQAYATAQGPQLCTQLASRPRLRPGSGSLPHWPPGRSIHRPGMWSRGSSEEHCFQQLYGRCVDPEREVVARRSRRHRQIKRWRTGMTGLIERGSVKGEMGMGRRGLVEGKK